MTSSDITTHTRNYHVAPVYDKSCGGRGVDRLVRFTRFIEEGEGDLHYDEVIVSSMRKVYDDKGKVMEQNLREVARIDLVLEEVAGASNFFSGGRPRGVPIELLGVIDEYLRWVREGAKENG